MEEIKNFEHINMESDDIIEKNDLLDLFRIELDRKKRDQRRKMFMLAGNLIYAADEINKVVDDSGKLSELDLNMIAPYVAMPEDEYKTVEAYQLFAKTENFKLNDEQKTSLKKQFMLYLNNISDEIKNKTKDDEELKELEEQIACLEKCLELLKFDDDFTLDDYINVAKMIKPYKDAFPNLMNALADYTNILLIKANQQRDRWMTK